jgi:hypothetical protein
LKTKNRGKSPSKVGEDAETRLFEGAKLCSLNKSSTETRFVQRFPNSRLIAVLLFALKRE